MITALILTPAAFAIAPAAPAQTAVQEPVSYDWQTQSLSTANPKDERWSAGTFQGTKSYVSSSYTIDDWNSD